MGVIPSRRDAHFVERDECYKVSVPSVHETPAHETPAWLVLAAAIAIMLTYFLTVNLGGDMGQFPFDRAVIMAARKRQLNRCARCGKALMTQAEIEAVDEKQDLPPLNFLSHAHHVFPQQAGSIADSSDVDQGFRVKAIRVPAIPIKVGAQRRWRD